jgi:hypothetical protein
VRQNPIYSRHRCRPVISNIPGSVPWILFVILTSAICVPLVSLSSSPVRRSLPPSEQVETRIHVDAHDRQHRHLPFTIYVLTEQFSWKLESAVDLQGGQTLLSAELIRAINRSRDVLCVGTASFEGATRTEETRAGQRARKIAEWVRAAILDQKGTHLVTLNVGQYVGPEKQESAHQRKAIIIATGQHDENADLSEALQSGLEQEQETSPVVYSLLHHYSRSGEWLKSLATR